MIAGIEQEAGAAAVPVTPESLVNVLGVVYVHAKTSDGGELYLTRLGLPFADLLAVENWYEGEWFRTHAQRLEGTSAVHRVPTKTVGNRNLELVVKNCRVGEDVPLDTHTLAEFINAEFNSPWEEFALVMEMREGVYGPKDLRISTQDPLAIYVPPERLQIWQTGRSVEKIEKISARHRGIDLDILKQYKLIYGWIWGKNAIEVLMEAGLRDRDLNECLVPVTRKVMEHLERKGYAVADMKPAHIIIGESSVSRFGAIGDRSPGDRRTAQTAFLAGLVEEGRYSVIDYELLLRTPPHEKEVKFERRHVYLDVQRDRFIPAPLPPHLKAMEIYGVPYIFGHVESTGGALWVVGRNPAVFDYFLPERWRRTPSRRLSKGGEIFYTLTKDNVHIVWKTSRVGEKPAAADSRGLLMDEYGYNSPFEEFGIAHFLNTAGIPTVYARAIYMTGTMKQEQSADRRRYESHAGILRPDGRSILQEEHNYISIRGFFNGPDSWVASHESQFYKTCDLLNARDGNIISAADYDRIYGSVLRRLRAAGYDGSLLAGNDMLLAIDPLGAIVKDNDGLPEVRICNFEFIRKIDNSL